MRLAIRNGRVAQADGLRELDVLVEDGRILDLGHGQDADREIDARGCYVLPGFMDFHTHVDDHIGRFYLADSYETATRQALVNGITSLATFVTQAEGHTLRQAMAAAWAKALDRSHCDVLWHLTPTTFAPGDLSFLEAAIGSGYRTLKLYTTYRPAGLYASYQRLEELFTVLGGLGVTFMVHCEDDGIIAGIDREGMDFSKAATHALLRPEAAELEAIRRLIGIAQATGASMHVVHVSTVGGARMLLEARQEGDITCETCPQYLVLDTSWLDRADGHRWLCSPPLRDDREAFRQLARDGAFEVIATDHCPFRPQDKDSWNGLDIRQVPNGLPGLGALPHVTWKIWEDDPDRAALGLATHLATNPALRAGVGDRKGAILPGLDADLVVLDPNGPAHPIRSAGVPAFEPFPGFTTNLHFRSVLLRGVPRVQDGRLLEPDRPTGIPLQPDPETLPIH